MEFLILLAAILMAGFGIVIWLRVSDEWAERDKWRRFEATLRAAQDNRYTDDDPRRPE